MTAQPGSGKYFSFGGCELEGSLAAGNLGYDANRSKWYYLVCQPLQKSFISLFFHSSNPIYVNFSIMFVLHQS
jgi:hypothetical protein